MTGLLGADDKAGIAEIVSAIVYLKEHPEIKLPRRREAVYDTVKAAYKDILSLDRSPFPDRPVGYLIRSVDKAGIVDRYMPAFYSIEALQK